MDGAARGHGAGHGPAARLGADQRAARTWPRSPTARACPRWSCWRPAVPGATDDAAALSLTGWVLEVVQAWLAAPGLDAARLVVVTRGAVPADGEQTVTDPAAAAVWGLVRVAQAENPDRIVLLDTDATASDVESQLAAVLATGEPQVAVRGSPPVRAEARPRDRARWPRP